MAKLRIVLVESDTLTKRPEQRAEMRLRCPKRPTVALSPQGTFEDTVVVVQDISRRGISFLTTTPLSAGLRVALLWQFGPEHEHRTLTATVRHVAKVRSGGSRVGCALDTPLTMEDLRAIVAWRSCGPWPGNAAEIAATPQTAAE